MLIILILIMLAVIVTLGFYAGRLVYKLRQQNSEKKARTEERISNIVESITTIAAAMDQNQCNMSEGCIRLYHLLETLPLVNKPDYSKQYIGVYSLYNNVKELASHDARKQLSSEERRIQDSFRENVEAELNSVVLADAQSLKSFSI